jgi:chitodextrinase
MSAGESVYAQFRDVYGNTTDIASVTPPNAPSNMFFQDVSNSELLDWRIFFAWGVITEPSAGFDRYIIYRSTDGGSFDQLTTINTRAENFYVDTGLATESNYSYKIVSEDNAGNISFYSSAISHTPDGSGGSDITPPTLTDVEDDNITTTSVTITWTTDKLSNSTVYYANTSDYPGADSESYTHSIGVPSMVTEHSVTVSGLSPDSEYYFMLESTDASDNIGTLSDESFSFETEPGPVISNVTVPTIFNTEATVSWHTDTPSNSIVTYSLASDLSDSETAEGDGELTESHGVTLSGLSAGTKYYYFVSSTDGDGDTAIDQNVTDGTVSYYQFVTTSDPDAPVISDVATSLVGENGVAITWATDKPALSQVEWGITEELGTLTAQTNTYTFGHSVVLNNLSSTTEYFYKVISEDKNDNVASSSINSFTTLAPTIVTNTVTITESGGGGGGSRTIDNRDLEAPVISDISVAQVGARSAIITFTTSKIASGQVRFGPTAQYGSSAGDPLSYRTVHRVVLTGLTPSTQYHFAPEAEDIYENQGIAPGEIFTTLESSVTEAISEEVALTEEERNIVQKVQNASPIFVEKILESLLTSSNLANVSDATFTTFLSDFASQVGSSPAISGPDIVVETGPRSAIIRWTTDKPANSLVSYARSDEYRSNEDNPYTITAGLPDDAVTNHVVTLPNLEPNTVYHFSARSQSTIGPVSLSGDRTFQTTSLFPQIDNLRFTAINETDATLNWTTDFPTKTELSLTNAVTGEVTNILDESYVKEHTVVLPDLQVSTAYTVALKAVDNDGNISTASVLPFSTVLSREAPKVSNVRISTALIPNQSQKAQTIISWETDKPATSRVFFAEGLATELNQSTTLQDALVKDHIIVTTALSPGSAYTLKVQSGDSGGNVTDSDRYSILTPKLPESVLDLIFGNLNKTFGFLKK